MQTRKLIIDTVYQTPSGLGGIFRVKYIGKLRHNYLFKNVTPNWKSDLYTYSSEQVESAIHPLKVCAKMSEILHHSQRN